jgi:hypothetical protein
MASACIYGLARELIYLLLPPHPGCGGRAAGSIAASGGLVFVEDSKRVMPKYLSPAGPVEPKKFLKLPA